MKNVLFALLLLVLVTRTAGWCRQLGEAYGKQDDVFQWTCLQTQRYYMQQLDPNDLDDPPISQLNTFQKWFYEGCMSTLNTANNKLKCWSLMFMPDPSVSAAKATATVQEDRFDATFTKRSKQSCYDKAKKYSVGGVSPAVALPVSAKIGNGSAVASPVSAMGHKDHNP